MFTRTVKFAQCTTLIAILLSTQWCEMTGMAAEHKSWLTYIGTYTSGKSKGIYSAQFDSGTGKLTSPALAAETRNPTFLAVHPSGRYLYAVEETGDFRGKPSGAVGAFSITQTDGKLTLLNEQASGGDGPCHLSVDKSGKCLLVANYGGGSIEALSIAPDGRLREPSSQIRHQGSSVDRERQTHAYAHFITTDPQNRFALVCDLGLDKVLVYSIEPSKASLVPGEPPSVSITPGSGPRHLAFHPNGRFIYLVNEMSATVTVLSYQPESGVMKEVQTISALPGTFAGFKSGAEIQVHPSGKFVYSSNRGHNSIAVFAVDENTGKLALVEHQSTQGKTPRHFAIDPTGKWLLAENQDSNNIVIFRIDQETGKLSATGDKIEVGAPVCIQFVPDSEQ